MMTEEQKARNREQTKRWRLQNPEKWQAIRKKSLEKNREKNNLRTKEWREKNPEKDHARKMAWKAANLDKWKLAILKSNRAHRDKVNKRNRDEYAAKLASVLTLTFKAEIRRFYADAKRKTAETGIPHVVDHIVPLIGENFHGLHVPWNLQVITAEENVRKGNQMVVDR